MLPSGGGIGPSRVFFYIRVLLFFFFIISNRVFFVCLKNDENVTLFFFLYFLFPSVLTLTLNGLFDFNKEPVYRFPCTQVHKTVNTYTYETIGVGERSKIPPHPTGKKK